MENNFLNKLKQATNYIRTENGAIAHKTTNSAIYDLFALGGSYRKHNDLDIMLLFKNAYEEDKNLALKCLFYLRDITQGQGERKFFRIAFNWLCQAYPEDAEKLLQYIPEYGRWDDLIYATLDTSLETRAMIIIKEQLFKDLVSNSPSLLAKWLPSENTSAHNTKYLAHKIRKYLNMTHKQYRQTLSDLRYRINIVERLMSNNQWDKIEFNKLPSKAGLLYKDAFMRRELIAQKYKNFIKSEKTTVNTKALYPYEIVNKALKEPWYKIDAMDQEVIEKYWNNLPDYFENGKYQNILCVVDTSGSMTSGKIRPIDIAISLGIYAGERCKGPFKDHYISFASKPQLIKIEGINFVDKVQRIYKTNLIDNTNLTAVFNLLKQIALNEPNAKETLPDCIVVISDMEIDEGTQYYWGDYGKGWTTETTATEMELIRKEWDAAGLTLPNLVYWNVDARNNVILDSGDSVSFVSGASPILFEQICKGIKGIDLMYSKLLSNRYKQIHI